MIGRDLKHFHITAKLGEGGMGEVYRARDTRLDRDVAIKVLPERFTSAPERLRRMEAEARAVAALDHPNILTVYDVGTENDRFFIVYELLEGVTLRERLSDGALALRQVVDLGSQVAAALAAAHECGVVHRDVKPENLFITRDGRLKVLDFGLARQQRSNEDDEAAPTLTRHTEPGTVLGTSGYMAPEQARGEEVDPRADIFALGAVLYEMATGRRAFGGSTVADTLSAVLREDPPPLSELAPEAPFPLGRIVERCLEKSPGARFQSARDLEFALRELALTPSEPGQPASSSEAQPVERVLHFELQCPEGALLTGQLALAPDASRIAFVATTAEGHDLLWVKPLDAPEARPLPQTEGAAFPFWSPDGRALACFADGKLKRVDPAGFRPPQTLCPAPLPRGGAWSPDGTIVFSAAAGGEVRSVPQTGGEPRPIDHLVSRGGELYRWPSFLPDGRRFLCYVLSDDPEVIGLHLASLDSASTRRIVKADWGGLYAPPGLLLFRIGDQLMCQPFDADRGETTGASRPVVENVWWDGISTILTACTISANGVLAYQTGGLARSELVWHERDGSQAGVAGPPGAYFEPELSPDGLKIAVPGIGPAGLGLYLLDVERGTLFPFDTESEAEVTPVWRPDGKRIAYSRFPSGKVMVANAEGRARPDVLFEPEAFSPLSDWSRDGRTVFYNHIDFRTFQSEIRMHDLELGETRSLASDSYSNGFAKLSPDGRWIAYQTEALGAPEIVVQDFPELESRVRVSVEGGTQPRWHADGGKLYYVSRDRKIMAVSMEVEDGGSLRPGTPQPLFQTRILPLVEARNHYDVSPDGGRFLVNSRRAEDESLTITVIVGWQATLGD